MTVRSHLIASVRDVTDYIDSKTAIRGRALAIWILALSGLFLDAYSNSALSAGLGALTSDLHLSALEVSTVSAISSAVALLFAPIGGWLADRYGRMSTLLAAKALALIGAALAAFAPNFEMILAGRFLVGAAYGIDFSVALALLAEITPARFKSRLNAWQGVWYIAVCSNLAVTVLFYQLDTSIGIWRFSLGSAGVVALGLLIAQALVLVESPAWHARKARLDSSAVCLAKIYGERFEVAPAGQIVPVPGQANRGLANLSLLFRGIYRRRTILAATISFAQSLQYFAIGWYLPVISLSLFGEDFVVATLGALVFNVFGIVGGLSSPALGKKLGMRSASAFGFGLVFLMLLLLGSTFGSIPLWAAFVIPSAFILFHSAGPGGNGNSISALSYRSEIRATANGFIGALSNLGGVAGLFLFPIINEWFGTGAAFLIFSLVPLAAFIVCSVNKWEPTKAEVGPDEELDAPTFGKA